MSASLDNLANAPIQKNDTMDKLVTTNQQQAKIIANLTEAIIRSSTMSLTTLVLCFFISQICFWDHKYVFHFGKVFYHLVEVIFNLFASMFLT
jgi:hypothetical protein